MLNWVGGNHSESHKLHINKRKVAHSKDGCCVPGNTDNIMVTDKHATGVKHVVKEKVKWKFYPNVVSAETIRTFVL